MRLRLTTASGALALALIAPSAHADSFSLGGPVGYVEATEQTQVRQPGHNRYQPYAGPESRTTDAVFASGSYATASRSSGVHNRYTN